MSSWRKNGQDLAQTSRKWRKKISNGESDGERKIYPSANPDHCILILYDFYMCVLRMNLGSRISKNHFFKVQHTMIEDFWLTNHHILICEKLR